MDKRVIHYCLASVLINLILASTLVLSIPQATYSPANTTFLFDFDGVVLTNGLLKRAKKIQSGTAGIIRQLKEKGYRVDGGTNNSQKNVAFYLKKFPHLFRLFTKIKAINSRRDKAKPSRSYFYDYLTRYADKKKKHIIFVDDRPDNVQSAQSCGLSAIQFTSPEQLEQQLKDMGIL